MPASNLPSYSSTRRFFLRATGVSLALPLLESLGVRVFAQNSAAGSLPGRVAGAARPKRMVCIGNLLGFYPQAFFPTKTGADYELPESIEALKPHQKDFTLFSGLDHGVKGGHFAMSSFLSGVRTADAKGMPEGNITVDQRAAETLSAKDDPKTRPWLNGYALASRLSYFLWSTMPDAELLRLAQSQELTEPEVLIAQTRRMTTYQYKNHSLTDGRYRYTRYGGKADGAEELYDHAPDPVEHKNLAATPEHPEIIARLKKHLQPHNEPDSPGSKNGTMLKAGRMNSDE